MIEAEVQVFTRERKRVGRRVGKTQEKDYRLKQ